MTVNFKGNAWELQLSNAVFCHFLFSIDVKLSTLQYIFIPLHYWDILTAVFCVAFAYVLAIHNYQIWNKKVQGVRGKGLIYKGSLSARVTFVPTFSLEVWFHGKCREYIVQL